MKKFMIVRSLFFAAAVFYAGTTPSTSCGQDLCSCGPDYCLKDPRYPGLLKAKKQRLRAAGFNDDLIALLDRDGACVAAVQNGPDTFFIKRMIGGGWDTRELNAEREDYARADLLSGTTGAYYKFNTSRAQDCCGQPKFDKRPDWDSSLELNLSLVIICKKSGSKVVCQNAK